NDVLSNIHDRGMIVGHEAGSDAWIEVKGKGRTNLVPFGELIHNYIESYWIAMRSSLYLKNKKKQEKELVKNIQKQGIKMYKKGEISKAEALSRLNYLNAIKFLADAEILLATNEENEGKKDVKTFSLTEDKNRIESLRHKLFKLMT
ncbi:MAG: hypothetical protein KJN62_09370, partial [Deltaproteobacteria bacterium]|nr:hypothetical protein [Deltaproteobacteria bacterium]